MVALPRNSVGANQIRSDAVGRSELRSGAIRSSEIRNRAIGLRDISLSARKSLRGQQGATGPQGPPITPFTAAVNAAGSVRSTTAVPIASLNPGTGVYEIDFNRDLRSCYAVASLSRFSPETPAPEAGEIATETTPKGVLVRTRNSGGAPADLPFHVIVVC